MWLIWGLKVLTSTALSAALKPQILGAAAPSTLRIGLRQSWISLVFDHSLKNLWHPLKTDSDGANRKNQLFQQHTTRLSTVKTKVTIFSSKMQSTIPKSWKFCHIKNQKALLISREIHKEPEPKQWCKNTNPQFPSKARDTHVLKGTHWFSHL